MQDNKRDIIHAAQGFREDGGIDHSNLSNVFREKAPIPLENAWDKEDARSLASAFNPKIKNIPQSLARDFWAQRPYGDVPKYLLETPLATGSMVEVPLP
jgi:hypothetical protein